MGATMGSFEVIGSLDRRQTRDFECRWPCTRTMARKINSILAAINLRVRPDVISLGHLGRDAEGGPVNGSICGASSALGGPVPLG